jgi:hypothetical protein
LKKRKEKNTKFSHCSIFVFFRSNIKITFFLYKKKKEKKKEKREKQENKKKNQINAINKMGPNLKP